jgi:hypothetical protein
VVEAIFVYNTAMLDQMLPRKPLPRPRTGGAAQSSAKERDARRRGIGRGKEEGGGVDGRPNFSLSTNKREIARINCSLTNSDDPFRTTRNAQKHSPKRRISRQIKHLDTGSRVGMANAIQDECAMGVSKGFLNAILTGPAVQHS